MDTQFINVGFGNIVAAHRIVGVMKAESSPMKRLRQDSKNSGLLVDMTEGRKTRSMILMDTSHVVLSAIQADTLTGRLNATGVIDLEENDEKEG